MKGVGRESVAAVITSARLDLIWTLMLKKGQPGFCCT